MDWKKLISELLDAGMSQVDIGRELGRSQAWVSVVATGKKSDVSWTDGHALIALHRARNRSAPKAAE